jgi:hypothetical protein
VNSIVAPACSDRLLGISPSFYRFTTPGEITAKTLTSQLLHSLEVLDPIGFPRFSTIG